MPRNAKEAAEEFAKMSDCQRRDFLAGLRQGFVAGATWGKADTLWGVARTMWKWNHRRYAPIFDELADAAIPGFCLKRYEETKDAKP